jgi:hypothetical protein
VNFVFWAALFCLWIFTTLLALVVKDGSKPDGNLDPLEIVVIALWAYFNYHQDGCRLNNNSQCGGVRTVYCRSPCFACALDQFKSDYSRVSRLSDHHRTGKRDVGPDAPVVSL